MLSADEPLLAREATVRSARIVSERLVSAPPTHVRMTTGSAYAGTSTRFRHSTYHFATLIHLEGVLPAVNPANRFFCSAIASSNGTRRMRRGLPCRPGT